MPCSKIKYPSKKHAEKAMRSIKKTGKIIPPDAHIYLCGCGNYHLGHDKFYKEKNKFLYR